MTQTKLAEKQADEILDTCLKAGRLMLEGGSEIYRVEDTMLRIAHNAGVEEARCFITPTGIFMSLGQHSYTQITQVKNRNINLELVDRVNELSRKFAAKEITLKQLRKKLQEISRALPDFPIWLQILGATIMSPTLMILFMGAYDWADFLPAAIIGGGSYGFFLGMKRYTSVRFLAELVTAIVMATSTICLCHLLPILKVDNIIIGALMTLVPGVAITNALRDLFTGDLLSGISRAVEALLTAVALGGGIGFAIKVFAGGL
ncbi:threonine/serine exporter family protein [Lactobacillus sp. PV037]|uniref:threonine/serine exporter family protein n=1 Tax=Lactobacillus sp. PV037 TaxID=2594496 RepID=UPI0022404FEE|nr:threonine/serine exporter family protein [Lactobacillus sp. PV037]QNQ83089.1 threonine/serine exporter family protein [Lactobacillus sp. PV037]